MCGRGGGGDCVITVVRDDDVSIGRSIREGDATDVVTMKMMKMMKGGAAVTSVGQRGKYFPLILA